jgi:hypothetical protein
MLKGKKSRGPGTTNPKDTDKHEDTRQDRGQQLCVIHKRQVFYPAEEPGYDPFQFNRVPAVSDEENEDSDV